MAFKIAATETPAILKMKQFCSIENLNQIVTHLIADKPGKVDRSVIEIIRGILLVNQ